MSKIIIFVVMLFCFFGLSQVAYVVSATEYKETGHSNFNRIYSIDLTEFYLIKEMKVESYVEKVKRKMFGYSVYLITDNVEIGFVGDTVFSKANNTREVLSFTYTYEVEESVEQSVTVQGDLAMKGSGKVKGVSLALDTAIRATIGKKTKMVVTESTKTTFNIAPKRHLSLVVKGRARLNNGASRYYFMWIPFSSGLWEYIDVTSEYYEFVEEAL